MRFILYEYQPQIYLENIDLRLKMWLSTTSVAKCGFLAYFNQNKYDAMLQYTNTDTYSLFAFILNESHKY